MKINKDMKIGDILKKYPETLKVFISYDLGCVDCPMSEPETINDAADVHGIDVNKFVDDLNKAIDNNQKIK